jgi:hypothetical protein
MSKDNAACLFLIALDRTAHNQRKTALKTAIQEVGWIKDRRLRGETEGGLSEQIKKSFNYRLYRPLAAWYYTQLSVYISHNASM